MYVSNNENECNVKKSVSPLSLMSMSEWVFFHLTIVLTKLNFRFSFVFFLLLFSCIFHIRTFFFSHLHRRSKHRVNFFLQILDKVLGSILSFSFYKEESKKVKLNLQVKSIDRLTKWQKLVMHSKTAIEESSLQVCIELNELLNMLL